MQSNIQRFGYRLHEVSSTKEEWEYMIDQTNNRWQFPNCYTKADGKQISIICPKNSYSQFYNYKGFFSIVLLPFVIMTTCF